MKVKKVTMMRKTIRMKRSWSKRVKTLAIKSNNRKFLLMLSKILFLPILLKTNKMTMLKSSLSIQSMWSKMMKVTNLSSSRKARILLVNP